MGKSAKKSNVEAKIAAAPVPEPHVKSAKKGKRDAEEAIDKVVKVKKQKIVEEVVTKQKDVKKQKKASREPPPKKKPDTSSSEDVTSSDSEKETEAKVSLPSKKLPATVAKNAANVILKKKQDTSDSSVSDSSSDEEMKPVIPISKTSIPISRKKPESSDSSSESDSDEDDEVKVAQAQVPVKGISSASKVAPTSVSKKNKEASDSSEDDSDSDSDDDKTHAPSNVSKPITKVVKKDSSSDEDDSSDDEPSQPIQNKKTPMSSNLDKPGAKAVIKGIRSDEDESDSSEESSDDEPSKAQQNKKTLLPSNAGKPAVKASKPAVKAVKKDSSSNEDTSSEESSDDEPSKKLPNKATVEESSDESTDDSDGGPQHKKLKTPVPSILSMSKTTVAKKDSDSDEDDDDSSEESSDEEPSKAQQNKETDVKMKDANGKQTAPISEKKGPKTPAANQSQASGTKTLFVGNLSYHIERDEVSEFFSQAGEVVGVRLATSADGSLRGFGHVEFATEEDAQKALEELNGQELSGRAVRLDKAPERGAYTPNSGKEDNSYQKGGRDQSQTIFIRGFDKSHEEDQIRTSLEEHFGSCGEITRVSIPMDYGTGASKGIAYMEFKEQDGSSKAMELSGSELEGHSLTVELAKPKGDSRDGGGRSGGGRSGGWRGRDSGGRFGSRDGGRRGRDGGGRFGVRRGRDGGDRGRGRGYNRQSDSAVSTGKKIKFGED